MECAFYYINMRYGDKKCEEYGWYLCVCMVPWQGINSDDYFLSDRHNHLGRGNFTWGVSSIALAYTHVCEAFSWLLIYVGDCGQCHP